MRHFDTMLFCGNGKTSEADLRLLRRRLNDALSLNSAIQQGYRPTSDELNERVDVVRDVAAAVLGRNIELGRTLPYPGKRGSVRDAKTGKRVK